MRNYLYVVYVISLTSFIGCDGSSSKQLNERAPEISSAHLSLQSHELPHEHEAIATASGVISSALDGMPVSHAQVSLVGTLLTTQTDDEGRYELPTRDGFHRIGLVRRSL